MKKFFTTVGGAIRSYIKGTDKFLLLLMMTASVISCLLLYSLVHAGMIGNLESFENITSFKSLMICIQNNKVLFTQIFASLAGIIVVIVISKIDYHSLANLWKLHAPLTLLMSFLVFTPLGEQRGGDGMGSDDRNWLNLGFTVIQPSEFLKISFILTLALHAFTVRKELNKPKNVLLLCVHGAIPSAIIMKQGDFGSMLVFVFIFIAIMFVAGLNWKYMFAGGVLGALGVAAAWQYGVIPTYLKRRFELAFHPELDKLGHGNQQFLGRITLGSGQLFGKGLLSNDLSTTTPELYNDMMFAHIGQVFGFVGCVAVALILTLMCAKILINARSADDLLGTYICVGVFAVVFFQSVINIGMVLCLAPIIGITLPFFSAGGSSVLTMYMCVGLAVSVCNNSRKSYMF